MRIALVQDNAINESLALTDLSAYLRARGHDLELFLDDEERSLDRAIQEYRADLLLFPCSILNHNWVLRTAGLLKDALEIPTAAGGTHPTFYPGIIQHECIDYAVRGEAEGAFADLFEALSSGGDYRSIPNLMYCENGEAHENPLRPLIVDLDSLPMPDRDLYYKYPFIMKFPWKKFTATRGCVHSCAYCFNQSYQRLMGIAPARFLRRKSVGRILREVKYIKDRYPLSNVHFSDDTFATDMEWLKAFASEYRRMIGVLLSCNLSVEYVSEERISLLREAGCRSIAIGIETADEDLRRKMLNKDISNNAIRQAAQIIKRNGILLVTFNIVGLPGEPVHRMIDTLIFNRELKVKHARVAIAVPIPNTQFTEICIENGYLDKDFFSEIDQLPDLWEMDYSSFLNIQGKDEMMILYRLWFLLLKIPLPRSWIRRLTRGKSNRAMALFQAVGLYFEKRVFHLSLLPGLRYFLHVRSLQRRTTNYVSLI